MYYAQVQDNGNSRTMINTWLGYNHNYQTSNGEFFDCQNLSSDLFPIMSSRKIRKRLAFGDIKGILNTDNMLCFLDGNSLHYGARIIELDDLLGNNVTWQNMYRFGAYILMFPSMVYVNVYKDSDKGKLTDAKYVTPVNKTVTYTMCNSEGNAYENITASDVAPSNPSKNDYWVKTTKGEQGLYVWDGTSWQPVATSYVKIEIQDANLTDYFEEQDVVYMNGFVNDLNNGSVIESITDTSIIVMGILDYVQATYTTSPGWKFTLERKMPKLNYICVDKNRVWGCYYGYVDGQMVNEIYCSKLGDFKNWYSYRGIASDSYAVTVGVPEAWTGCISYQGYPTFFKENAIFRVYGSTPSTFQINQIDARGVQKGSDQSLAIVNEHLVYKSSVDICVFDGSTPQSISDNLGREENYYDAIAGGCMGKYLIEMQTNIGSHELFVYDFKTNTWQKEDPMEVLQFSSTENGQIYAATETDIYGMGDTSNMVAAQNLVDEEWVDWYAVTGEMGYEYVDYKYVSRLTLRAYLPFNSEVKINISYDDMPYVPVGILRGNDEILTQSLSFAPMRCDHYKLKFEGHGDFRIYSLGITLDNGSEEDGYKNR